MRSRAVIQNELKRALACAVQAAAAAGRLMRENFRRVKSVTLAHQHDIKLELDVRCQKRIERLLRSSYPAVPILGEEGILGDPESEHRWVVDPIDGTVNFAYGIPHACVSVALQGRGRRPSASRTSRHSEEYQTLVGVVYDPFCEEMWTAIQGGPAKLNGRRIRVSQRTDLGETILSVGFAKYPKTREMMLPVFVRLVRRARKVRIMGAAALGLVYVATGRFDAYLEPGIRLWDIAAGGLIVECAGGEFWREPLRRRYAYRILAHNGRLRRKLQTAGNLWAP